MSDHVYKIIEVTGSSETSSDDAVRRAIEIVSQSISNLRWFTVEEIRGHLRDNQIAHWQVTVKVGFTVAQSAIDSE